MMCEFTLRRMFLFVLIVASGCSSRINPPWKFHGPIADGMQMDAVRGPNGLIHLIAERYCRLNSNGDVIIREDQGDTNHNKLNYPPSIAAGPDGTVHIVTRDPGGGFNDGYNLRYRCRDPTGLWKTNYIYRKPEKRNYIVGVAADGSRNVFLLSTNAGENVWGVIKIFREAGGKCVLLGQLGRKDFSPERGIWRCDTGVRMRGFKGRIYLASGLCDRDGAAYIAFADGPEKLVEQFKKTMQRHKSGSGRKGFPDLYVADDGSVHFTYGAQIGVVYYNRYDSEFKKVFADDRKIFEGLGKWHMSAGLSAVAASDDGKTVVAVALKTDDSKEAADSTILWACSKDGGKTWSKAKDTGRKTHGGEGRLTPRLIAIDKKFFLLYYDNAFGKICLATLET